MAEEDTGTTEEAAEEDGEDRAADTVRGTLNLFILTGVFQAEQVVDLGAVTTVVAMEATMEVEEEEDLFVEVDSPSEEMVLMEVSDQQTWVMQRM